MSASALGQPGRGRACFHWQGQMYHGAKAVAAAAGVSLNTVFRHLRIHGNLDAIAAAGSGRYEWRGKRFCRQADVADAAGVTRSAVAQHLMRRGNLDTLGVGVGGSNSREPIPGCPVRIGPRRWDSISAFARELGVSRLTARRWISTGDMERIQACLMAADARDRKARAA